MLDRGNDLASGFECYGNVCSNVKAAKAADRPVSTIHEMILTALVIPVVKIVKLDPPVYLLLSRDSLLRFAAMWAVWDRLLTRFNHPLPSHHLRPSSRHTMPSHRRR